MSWTADLARRYVLEVEPWLYHLTDAENLESILRDGLWPGKESQFDPGLVRPDCVYLCSSRIASWALAGELDADWGDAVVAVRVLDLHPDQVVGDEDYYRDSAADTGYRAAEVLAAHPYLDQADRVDSSLRDGGTVAYRGSIPPGSLRVALVPDRPDLPRLASLAGPRRWAPLL